MLVEFPSVAQPSVLTGRGQSRLPEKPSGYPSTTYPEKALLTDFAIDGETYYTLKPGKDQVQDMGILILF